MPATHTPWSDATAYATSFARLCAGTVDRLLDALPDGDTLLDVGTGTGSVLAGALERGWDAVGVDPAQEMLEVASLTVPTERLRRASLPELPFADSSFDAVTANFVVNHLADPRRGVREVARVLVPNGSAALTIWPSDAGGMHELWNRVMAAAAVRPPSGARLPPDVDFERSPRGLAGLCEAAGLVVDVAEAVSWTFSIAPRDLWRGVEGGIGVIGRTYLHADSDGRTRLERAYSDLADVADDGLLHLLSTAIVTVAHRAPEADAAGTG